MNVIRVEFRASLSDNDNSNDSFLGCLSVCDPPAEPGQVNALQIMRFVIVILDDSPLCSNASRWL